MLQLRWTVQRDGSWKQGVQRRIEALRCKKTSGAAGRLLLIAAGDEVWPLPLERLHRPDAKGPSARFGINGPCTRQAAGVVPAANGPVSRRVAGGRAGLVAWGSAQAAAAVLLVRQPLPWLRRAL